ncbi:nitroreductase family protein [Oscillibacter sp.]|uniref:nitroreductase family protein n=1 Tax=Oscillibacter sp. TaxID=1945593 RepID=UPI00262E0FC8|nr:nitroreductase family protein [Oscillibacter sp.]MDD3347681.1 nitroreductase family protein [Oscillibacter sp.]
MEVMEALKGRQSVKSYLPKAVEPEKLEKVLEAGRLAPSAFNHQYRRFIVVDDPAVKRLLREKAGAQPMIEQAPVVLVLCATAETEFTMPCGEKNYPIDAALCGAYMMLEAYEQGLGTCWLGAFDAEAVKDVLGIPAQTRVVTMIPLGYHDGTQERKSRKTLAEIVGHNRY